jgi:hypothetical protein
MADKPKALDHLPRRTMFAPANDLPIKQIRESFDILKTKILATSSVVESLKRGRPRIEARGTTIEDQKPWLALNMSRATWYSRRKEETAK